MQYIDDYDFITAPGDENSAMQRSQWGQFQTWVGLNAFPETPFHVTSPKVTVTQQSNAEHVDWFKGKNTESVGNYLGNEFYPGLEIEGAVIDY